MVMSSGADLAHFSASCVKLSEALVGFQEKESVHDLLCSMGHVLLELYSEVKMSNSKRSNRESVNKMLYERRFSTPDPKSIQEQGPARTITASSAAQSCLIKRPVHRTFNYETESSFEYLTPKPDIGKYVLDPLSDAVKEKSVDYLADCKSLIDTIDGEKKNSSKEEQFFSASEKGEKEPPKQLLQVPAEHLSSDSETPRPQLSRQNSFKRQKSFRKKKSRTRPGSASHATTSDVETQEVTLSKNRLSVSRSITSSFLDVASPSQRTLKKREQRRRSWTPSDQASSDERHNLFSSDDQGASDTGGSKPRRIRDRLALNRNSPKPKPEPVPLHFSDLESELEERTKVVSSPPPKSQGPQTAKRNIKIVRSGSRCYVVSSTKPAIPTHRVLSHNNRVSSPPRVPHRHINRSHETTSLSPPQPTKDSSTHKRFSVPTEDRKFGFKRYCDNKNKATEQSGHQNKMLTTALRGVLAFAQIPNDKTLFEVEALVDYIGASVDELSFSRGARISVYEVRGSYYYGELGNRTGLVSLNHVEKCEWIYGDISIDKEVIAMYDYQSDVDGDLSFVAGEVIAVTEDLGEWYRGNIGNRTGIFPGNFVQTVEEEYMMNASGSTAPPPTSALPSADIKPICTGVMLEGYVTEDVELEEGDEVSILAQPDILNVYIQDHAGRRTWIKTDLLKINQEFEPPSNGPIGADRIPASLHCYSLYPYTAQNNDELTMKKDDIITVTEQSDPHWWIGRLGGEVGVLPANYVEQINDHDTWDTVKAWNANLSAAEDERTRQEAIHELISTEKTYIDDLLLVVEVFYNPLCSVATDDELSSVFVNWQQLILCNARLFRALYNNSDINSFESVGAVFLEEIDSLIGPYTKFCSSQRQAMLALQDGVSPVFKVKEKECAGSPKVGKLPLSTFLLKPMQRITKYPLLIKKILQHTRESHPDYNSLKGSLSRTEFLLTSVNEAVRATTRLEALQRVFDKCCDDVGERVPLNSTTNCLGPRKLIHFGSVTKTKGSKELFAVLFTDMLWVSRVDKGRYGNKTIDIDARDFDSIKFEPYRDPFLLNNVFLTDNNKNPPEQTFALAYNDKNYSFHCQSAKDATEWADHLNDAIRNATLLYHSHYKSSLPDPTVAGQATITLRLVEGLELALPPDEKATSLFVQASLHGHVQRTPVGSNKWDHTVHFVVQDVATDKINITVYKEYLFSPNLSLGKFDLSIQKLLKTGGPGPWNKRLILTDTNSGMVNVCIMLRYHGNR